VAFIWQNSIEPAQQSCLTNPESAYGRSLMTNPFENETGEYLVLLNHEGQHSLWPAFREVPAGWTAVGPHGKRQDCLHWIEASWTNMRPKSLANAMDKDKAASS
jgi:MbtH protein